MGAASPGLEVCVASMCGRHVCLGIPAQREAARHRVLVPAVLLQSVDREQRQLWVHGRVGANVQVDHLLYYVVLGGDRLSEHRAEQR